MDIIKGIFLIALAAFFIIILILIALFILMASVGNEIIPFAAI
ncbi:hypothetical protein [Methanococcoides sp. AM1]|nr:hypothetical protein [Methanococcoides sp. AM1]